MADEDAKSQTTLEAKPGWQTSEFYVTILTAFVPVTTLIFHRDFTSTIQPIAAVAACITTSIYTIARSRSKQHAMKATTDMRVAWINTHSPVSPPPSPPTPAPATSVSHEGGMAAVPIDTLASILAKLDRLVDEQHHKVIL